MEFAISQPKVVRLPRNEKQTYPLKSSTSNAANGFDHDLDLWIFKVKCYLDLWPHTWPWPWIFMVTFWNSCFSEWEGRLTLNEVGGSRSFMTVTVTIWWPRSGVRIYQIVTGVASVAGVLSTHLVGLDIDLSPVRPQVSILTNDFSLITPQSTDFNEKMLKLKLYQWNCTSHYRQKICCHFSRRRWVNTFLRIHAVCGAMS